MTSALRAALHPLAVYATIHQMNQRDTADFFHVPYGVYRQLVRGHTRSAFARMESWESRSGGEVSAIAAWNWQKKNAVVAGETPKPRAKKRRA